MKIRNMIRSTLNKMMIFLVFAITAAALAGVRYHIRFLDLW